MDRYQRVEKPRAEAPISENEIRITSQGRIRNYITYAIVLLQEKGSVEIDLKAMGRAMNKAVVIAELLKRRIVGLHQITSTGSIDITNTWEPLEEGLLPIETTRHVSVMSITLSKKELDKSSTGYQSPIPADQVQPLIEHDYDGEPLTSGRGGRGRGGGRGSGNQVAEYEEEGGFDGGYGYVNRGRGRGRIRGFRGRGRGYAGGYSRGNAYVESGGYDDNAGYEAAPPRGRGRGRGTIRGRGRGRGRQQSVA